MPPCCPDSVAADLLAAPVDPVVALVAASLALGLLVAAVPPAAGTACGLQVGGSKLSTPHFWGSVPVHRIVPV